MANLTGYDKFQIISVTGNKPAAPLSWFPRLVKFTADTGLNDYTQNAGLDIAFCVDGGDTELPCERLYWTDHGANVSAAFRVREPSVDSASDSDLRMHIGKAAGTAYATPEDTWNENGAGNFEAVWHLGDVGWAGGAPEALDSTGNAHQGTNDGTTNVAASVIGEGRRFDGTNDLITVPDHADLRFNSGAQDFTLSCWFTRNLPGGDAYQFLMDKRDANDDGWRLELVNGVVWASVNGIDVKTTTVITDTDVHLVQAVIDRSGNGQMYLDGSADGPAVSIGGQAMDNTVVLRIGEKSYTGFDDNFKGDMDEARIASSVRSAAWNLFEYDNVADYAGTITHGAWTAAGIARPKVGGSLAAGRVGLVR